MTNEYELSAVRDALSTAGIGAGEGGMMTDVPTEALADNAVNQAALMGFYGQKEQMGKGWRVTAKLQ
jgi:hypothetical protein